jgi:hypothetical protein
MAFARGMAIRRAATRNPVARRPEAAEAQIVFYERSEQALGSFCRRVGTPKRLILIAANCTCEVRTCGAACLVVFCFLHLFGVMLFAIILVPISECYRQRCFNRKFLCSW